MNLSAHPELKTYRDELAGSLGGGVAALERANGTAQRLYGAAIKHADTRRGNRAVRDKDISESVRTVVTAMRGAQGVIEIAAPGARAKPGKRKDAAVREAVSAAVKAAVGRVVAEAMNGSTAPAPARRPLHELSDDALMDRLGEAMLRTGRTGRVTETGQPEQPHSAMHDLDLTGDSKALHDLADDDFMDFLGAAFVADGEQRLGNPLFGNPSGVSPFMQGLADGYLGHLLGRVPDGQGNPAEADRRHQATLAAQELQVAARIVVDSIAGGDLGAARRYLHSLQHDPAQPVDPWRLVEHVATLALRRAAATADAGG